MPNLVESLIAIVDAVPELQQHKPALVRDYFELIARYAPTVASEPLLVGPQILHFCETHHIDLSAMQKICELEQALATMSTIRLLTTTGGRSPTTDH